MGACRYLWLRLCLRGGAACAFGVLAFPVWNQREIIVVLNGAKYIFKGESTCNKKVKTLCERCVRGMHIQVTISSILFIGTALNAVIIRLEIR